MIGCLKKIKVIPGKEQEFEYLLNQLKAQVALHEPGNEYYDLYKSSTESGVYIMMERYHDTAALEMHEQSVHGAQFFPELRSLVSSLEKECFESVDLT